MDIFCDDYGVWIDYHYFGAMEELNRLAILSTNKNGSFQMEIYYEGIMFKFNSYKETDRFFALATKMTSQYKSYHKFL